MDIKYYIKNPKYFFKKVIAKLILKKSLKKFTFQKKGNFTSRVYDNYGDYIKHQQSKFIINKRILSEVFDDKTEDFYKSFQKIDNFSKKNILCLASRDGAEVKAFRQLNANCIGIDLMYPENSKYVHYGDFHDIPYPDGVFDYVFTNSLDHSFDIQKIMSETGRVLKKEGVFLCDILLGEDEGYSDLAGDFEAFAWSKRDDLKKIIAEKHFIFEKEIAKDKNWSHCFFKKKSNN